MNDETSARNKRPHCDKGVADTGVVPPWDAPILTGRRGCDGNDRRDLRRISPWNDRRQQSERDFQKLVRRLREELDRSIRNDAELQHFELTQEDAAIFETEMHFQYTEGRLKLTAGTITAMLTGNMDGAKIFSKEIRVVKHDKKP